MKKNPKKLIKKIECRIIEHLRYMCENNQRFDDISKLHNELFNEDYWTIGSYAARKELQEFADDFDIVGYIQKREHDFFGTREFSDWYDSEKTLNMLVYFLSQDMMFSCDSLRESEGKKPFLRAIKKELCVITKKMRKCIEKI